MPVVRIEGALRKIYHRRRTWLPDGTTCRLDSAVETPLIDLPQSAMPRRWWLQIVTHHLLQCFHACEKRIPYRCIFGRFRAKRLDSKGFSNDTEPLKDR